MVNLEIYSQPGRLFLVPAASLGVYSLVLSPDFYFLIVSASQASTASCSRQTTSSSCLPARLPQPRALARLFYYIVFCQPDFNYFIVFCQPGFNLYSVFCQPSCALSHILLTRLLK